MISSSFDEGAVLWIEPALHALSQTPDGVAFLVQDFLGWADPGRAVWIRGVVIDPRRVAGRRLTLCVPTSQSFGLVDSQAVVRRASNCR